MVVSSEYLKFQHTAARRRLGLRSIRVKTVSVCFNTQPPEGGWAESQAMQLVRQTVSTHSRPKAAGIWAQKKQYPIPKTVSTHSRPKAAGLMVNA